MGIMCLGVTGQGGGNQALGGGGSDSGTLKSIFTFQRYEDHSAPAFPVPPYSSNPVPEGGIQFKFQLTGSLLDLGGPSWGKWPLTSIAAKPLRETGAESEGLGAPQLSTIALARCRTWAAEEWT